MQELREGIRLADRYALIKRIAAGGMAELWLAADDRADANVVLKFPSAELLSSAGHRELFRKEWQTASRLMHAHIVRVFEYHDDERPFYAQQHIDGPDIGALHAEPLENLLGPIGLVTDALRYAHGKGVIHRDLTARNILLDQRGAPYLIDFGIAGARTGGTPAASSPQQKAGEAPQAADDIYALGVLLHELLTGQPPGDSLSALRRPSGEAVPTAISALVERMLDADAERRPSAEEVHDALAAAGFPARAANLPDRFRGGEAADVEIESVRPAARRSPADTPIPAASREASGLSPRTVYGALAVLVAVLVGVTFLLPAAVDRSEPEIAVETVVPTEEDATDTIEDEVDPQIVDVVPSSGLDGDSAGFSENLGQTSTDSAVLAKLDADEALGDLLSRLERLKYRGVERWGGQPYLDALDVYAEGDEAYLNRNYPTAAERYARATDLLDPFFDRIDAEFDKAMQAAKAAFDRADSVDAIRLYDLATAITPGNADAERGLARARNLEAVLDLMAQGQQFLDELALEAARIAFEKALELDPLWEPAEAALESVRARITQSSFESRMTEGFSALAAQDFGTARAAFNAAKKIFPGSREPGDGLLQVDQEERLFRIRTMESEAVALESNEQWETAVTTYEALLEVDGDLAFAKDGLARSRERAAVHRRIQDYIDEPDALSDPVNMQNATNLLLSLSRLADVGPRLDDHKEVLARLLKRAATPLTVEFVSNNATEVSVYKVGRLGTFARTALELRPGTYVAVGVRNGYRDVREEFRVGPEIELEPIVVQCEEPI